MASSLEQYLEDSIGDLPMMPQLAADVMRAVEDPLSSADDIRHLIEQDPAIAARILKIANSAYYGFATEIESLSHAIAVTGMKTVKNLVLGVSLKGAYKRFELMEKLLWEHSAMAGPVAAMLAREVDADIDPEFAFTAGLLHDIGKAALANSHRAEYEHVMTRIYNEETAAVEAERDHFGFDHAVLGARVAERWALPNTLVTVIEHHHDPGSLSDLPEDAAPLTALIGVTTACLNRLGVGRRNPDESIRLESIPEWRFLGLGEDQGDAVLEQCVGQITAAKSLTE